MARGVGAPLVGAAVGAGEEPCECPPKPGSPHPLQLTPKAKKAESLPWGSPRVQHDEDGESCPGRADLPGRLVPLPPGRHLHTSGV